MSTMRYRRRNIVLDGIVKTVPCEFVNRVLAEHRLEPILPETYDAITDEFGALLRQEHRRRRFNEILARPPERLQQLLEQVLQ
jgi:hypothetical protein